MRVTFFLLLGVALALVLSVQAAPHRDWTKIGGVSSSQLMPVSFSLKNRNQEWLTKFVDEVSNPLHPNWRRYVTQEKLRELMAPSEAEVRELVNVLKSLGMKQFEVYPSGDFIMSQWSVQDVEQVFSVHIDRFRHVRSNQIIHRSLTQYLLPKRLQSIVDVVGMITEFPEGHFRTRGMGKSHQIPKRAQPKLATLANATDCSQGLMNWGYPASSDTDLYSQVQIVCCNGQFTKDVNAPCSDQGAELYGFATLALSAKNNATVGESTVSYASVQSDCFWDGQSVTCPINFTPHSQVEPYNFYNLQIIGLFGLNATNAPYSTFPVPLATSPFVTPQSFADRYEIPLHWTSRYPATNNSQSVVEFGGEYYSPSDLKSFFGNMSLPDTPAQVVGPNNGTYPGSEATLDIQWIMAVGVQVDTVFWSVGTGYLIEWTAQLLSASQIPLVNSVSYGGNEVDLPVDYRSGVDREFQKLAALGVSIVVSSGDAGATNVGHGSNSCVALLPQYPAASPFVTSVSATYFTPSDIPMCSIKYYGKVVHCADTHMGEIAVSAGDGMDWTTGGGFSGDVPRPSWQQQQVNNYLTQHANLLPPSSMFNSSNRAYPDVSATGHNLMLIRDDAMDIGDGTSASAPIFAGILSLINQYLISVGEAPLGFANPLLYTAAQQAPASFYDVTVGSNACGDVLHPPYIACCAHGYQSATGWDPVTGLGTPRFAPLFGAVKEYVRQQQMTA